MAGVEKMTCPYGPPYGLYEAFDRMDGIDLWPPQVPRLASVPRAGINRRTLLVPSPPGRAEESVGNLKVTQLGPKKWQSQQRQRQQSLREEERAGKAKAKRQQFHFTCSSI